MESKLFTYVDATPPEPAAGPLQGKTVAIQPNMSVRNWPTEAGSMALENYVALEDATIVQKIRRAGATVKGSSRMSELGFGLNADTAAEIIKNGLADIALVTDTLGEARIAGAIAETCVERYKRIDKLHRFFDGDQCRQRQGVFIFDPNIEE